MHKKILIAFGIAILAFIAYVGIVGGGIPYIYASYLESKWSKADPKTRSELETHLHLYSTRIILPSQSQWGKNYVLKNHERMIQYLILWNAPLDVVYDKNDNIIRIFTSYE